MFEGPEYVSYIELMRALRLEHRFKRGDWGIQVIPELPGGIYGPVISDPDSGEDVVVADEVHIWLPLLHDWIFMLAQVDPEYSRDIYIQWRRDGWYIARYINDWCKGPTLEEACARLFMAVTGREAPRG